mmetsp:Transcript_47962/g.154765  ORF Transcript_47962/g.154765 Transcript_47962/m.154765 type:complete len:325 (+) Transcript_47962:970-1944(+)
MPQGEDRVTACRGVLGEADEQTYATCLDDGRRAGGTALREHAQDFRDGAAHLHGGRGVPDEDDQSGDAANFHPSCLIIGIALQEVQDRAHRLRSHIGRPLPHELEQRGEAARLHDGRPALLREVRQVRQHVRDARPRTLDLLRRTFGRVLDAWWGGSGNLPRRARGSDGKRRWVLQAGRAGHQHWTSRDGVVRRPAPFRRQRASHEGAVGRPCGGRRCQGGRRRSRKCGGTQSRHALGALRGLHLREAGEHEKQRGHASLLRLFNDLLLELSEDAACTCVQLLEQLLRPRGAHGVARDTLTNGRSALREHAALGLRSEWRPADD